MELNIKDSCDGFPTDSSTSSKYGLNLPNKQLASEHKDHQLVQETPPECLNILSTTTSSSSMTPALYHSECNLHKDGVRESPNIGYELAVAKAIMQQYSTLSGDNLFDHLSDIIKRVIDERPPNVIDFFEEFSRNVREQKLHLPERFPPDAIYEEKRIYRVAKRLLESMRLPSNEDDLDLHVEDMSVEDHKSMNTEELRLDIDVSQLKFKTFNERVQQLQFYWNQCGFSISNDDIFQLACAMDRLQIHPAIMQCRFWGVINGLKASYYIVEASLMREEIAKRIGQMKEETAGKNHDNEKTIPSHIGPELTPGINGWETHDPSELAKMLPPADPVPTIQNIEVFDVPPEVIGTGLNRYSYFVVNSFADEWIELPIVTPKQIVISRHIKKFLTGDLEVEVISYPCFPGVEKHYLRAMIARITAGTYIAPREYYRKMTKDEKRVFEGIEVDEMVEENEEEEEQSIAEDEDTELDNDIFLLRNEKYMPLPLANMIHTANWVHVRPNILNQGRVVWFDEKKARKEREKELARLLKLHLSEEIEEEEDDEEEEVEEEEAENAEEGLSDHLTMREVDPPILHPCNYDVSKEHTIPWIARFTSKYTNKNERLIVMRSNIWPGAYTFIFETMCESIYMGWGHKYVARNMPFHHLRNVAEEFPHGTEDFIETTDPTVAEEDAYRLSLLKKQTQLVDPGEDLSEYDDNDFSHESSSEDN